MTDTYIENHRTLGVILLLLQEALKYSSAQWQFMDTKTITVDALAHAQWTCMKRSNDILVIIPQFDTEDLPHLVMEFIENIRDHNNYPYHRYPKHHDNFPIDRSVSLRARMHKNSIQDS